MMQRRSLRRTDRCWRCPGPASAACRRLRCPSSRRSTSRRTHGRRSNLSSSKCRDRHGDVLLLAAGVGEAEVDELDFVVLDHLHDVFGGCHSESPVSFSKSMGRLRLKAFEDAEYKAAGSSTRLEPKRKACH